MVLVGRPHFEQTPWREANQHADLQRESDWFSEQWAIILSQWSSDEKGPEGHRRGENKLCSGYIANGFKVVSFYAIDGKTCQRRTRRRFTGLQNVKRQWRLKTALFLSSCLNLVFNPEVLRNKTSLCSHKILNDLLCGLSMLHEDLCLYSRYSHGR